MATLKFLLMDWESMEIGPQNVGVQFVELPESLVSTPLVKLYSLSALSVVEPVCIERYRCCITST